jgi:hypothetical protein
MSYTEIELAKLIETVEKEFTVHLNKAEELHSLAKAEDSAPPKEKKESKPPEKKEAAPAEGESAPPSEDEAAPEEGAPPAEGQEAAPEEGAPPVADPAQAGAPAAGGVYDAEDLAHMQQMYASMSREELMAHHDAVRQALDAMGAQQAPGAAPAAPGAEAPLDAAPAAPGAEAPMDENMNKCGNCGASNMGKSEVSDENPELNSKPTDKGDNLFPDKKNGGIKGAPPHNALGAKSAASDANGAKINKSEHDRRNGGKQEAAAPGKTPGAKSPASNANGDKMNKSEGNVEVELLKSELEAEKASSAELKKSFDKATEVLAKLVSKVTVPQGKAITELGTITKGEDITGSKELSKSEVTELLKKQDYSKLTKSDRDAINSFYLGGSNFNTISHLFKN